MIFGFCVSLFFGMLKICNIWIFCFMLYLNNKIIILRFIKIYYYNDLFVKVGCLINIIDVKVIFVINNNIL